MESWGWGSRMLSEAGSDMAISQVIIPQITIGGLSVASLATSNWGSHCSRRPNNFTDSQYQCKFLGFRRKRRSAYLQEKEVQHWALVLLLSLGLCPRRAAERGAFTGTLAWHPGPWAWWSLGAVDDESSAWFSHCSSNSICRNQGQTTPSHSFTRTCLKIESHRIELALDQTITNT